MLRQRRLRFESLEHRRVLATILWDGETGSTSWHMPRNWSSNTVPTISDDVIIDVPSDVFLRVNIREPAFANSISFKGWNLTVHQTELTVANGLEMPGGSLILNGAQVNADINAGQGITFVSGDVSIDGDVNLVSPIRPSTPPRDQNITLDITGELTTSGWIELRPGDRLTVSDGIQLDDGEIQSDTFHFPAGTPPPLIDASVVGTGRLDFSTPVAISGDVDFSGPVNLGGPLEIGGDLTLRSEGVRPAGFMVSSDPPSSRWAEIAVAGLADIQAAWNLDNPWSSFPVDEVVPLITYGEAQFDLSDIVFSETNDDYVIEFLQTDTAVSYRAPIAPDFQILDVDVPDRVNPNQAVTINYSVAIEDGSVWGHWFDEVYLSDDPTLDPSDLAVGNVLRFARDGRQYESSVTFRWPSDQLGDAYLLMAANAELDASYHTEANRDNNVSAHRITADSDIDIQLAEVVYPDFFVSHEPSQLHWRLETFGQDPMHVVPGLNIYLSDDDALDENDFLVQTTTQQYESGPAYSGLISAFRPDQLSSFSYQEPGDYFLIFQIVTSPTSSDEIFDNDLSNNLSAFPITIVPPADIRLTILDLPSEAAAGDEVDVQLKLQNFSPYGPAVDTLSGSIKLSDAFGRFIKAESFFVPGIGPGSQVTGTISFRIPDHLVAGEYQWTLIYSNETVTKPVTVVRPPEPVAMADEFVAPSRHSVNEALSLSLDVQIDEPAVLRHRVFFSTDPWLDPDDLQILDNWQSYEVGNQQITLATNIPEGVNGNGFLILSSTTNAFTTSIDTLVRPIDLFGEQTDPLPEVIVTHLDTSFDPVADGRIVGTATITNLNASTDRIYLHLLGSDDTSDPDQTFRLGWLNVDLDPGRTKTVSFEVGAPSDVAEFDLFAVGSLSFLTPTSTLGASQFIPISIPTPDLEIVSVDVPDLLMFSDEISWVVRNLSSDVDAGPRTDYVYFSTNADGARPRQGLAIIGDIPSLEAGQTETYSFQLGQLLPETEGFIFFNVGTDEIDADYSNQSVSLPVRVARENLVMVGPPQEIELSLGNNQIELEFQNSGTIASREVNLRTAYLSNTDLPETSVSITGTIPAMEPGASAIASASVDVGKRGIDKQFLLLSLDQLPDGYQSLELAQPVPDPGLQITGPILPDTIDWTRPFPVTWFVENNGEETIDAVWSDGVYISDDETLDFRDDYLALADHPIEPLRPGERRRVSLEIDPNRIPEHFFGQDQFLIAATGSIGLFAQEDQVELWAAFPIRLPTPDLALSTVSPPTEYRTDGASVLPIIVTNNSEFTIQPRELPIDFSLTSYYPCCDFVAPQSIPVDIPLGPGESFQFDLPMPAFSVRPGSFGDVNDLETVDVTVRLIRFGGILDLDHSNNSISVADLDVNVQLPDLQVGQPVVNVHGQSATIDWAVTNVGNLAWEGEVDFLLSITPHDEDVLWQSTFAETFRLHPGQSLAFQRQADIGQDDFGTATRVLAGVTATRGPLPEQSLGNNDQSTFLPFAPDPVIESLQVTDDGDMRITIRNTAENSALKNATVELGFLRSDHPTSQTFSTSGFLLQLDTPIAPGETREIVQTFDLPNLQQDRFDRPFVRARLYSRHRDDFDTTSAIVPVTHRLSALRLEAANLPSILRPGQTVIVDYSVLNRSDSTIKDWYVSIDGPDEAMVYRMNQAIAAQSSVSGQIEWIVPDTEPGFLDFDFGVRQAGKPLDDRAGLQKSLLIAPADFSGLSIDGPERVTAGVLAGVSWIVGLNEWSRLDPTPWQDRVYLSVDQVLDDSDTLLTTIDNDVSRISAGDHYRSTAEVAFPLLSEASDYFLLVLVDEQGQRSDVDRSNNLISQPISISPAALDIDLVASSDTGISDQDNLTIFGPLFRIVAPASGILRVDIEGDGSPEYEQQIDEPGVITWDPDFFLNDGDYETVVSLDTGQGQLEDVIELTIDKTSPVALNTLQSVTAPWYQARLEFSEPVQLDAQSRANIRIGAIGRPDTIVVDGSAVVLRFERELTAGSRTIDIAVRDAAGNPTESEFVFHVAATSCFYQNPADAMDVNNDGSVTASDALHVINTVAQYAAESSQLMIYSEAFPDVDCSLSVTGLDALQIINYLAQNESTGDVEGEGLLGPVPARILRQTPFAVEDQPKQIPTKPTALAAGLLRTDIKTPKAKVYGSHEDPRDGRTDETADELFAQDLESWLSADL